MNDYRRAWAKFSDDRRFRYELGRAWAPDGPTCCFIMLNPSTADENQLDPTVRRCVYFARAWRYSRLVVGNLFALRSTDPRALYREPMIGDDWRNDDALVRMAAAADLVVAAWGNHGAYLDRGGRVLELLGGLCRPVHYLKLTKARQPAHPLYLRRDTTPTPFVAVHGYPGGVPSTPPGMERNRAPCGECGRFIESPDGSRPNWCARFDREARRFQYALAPRGRSCFQPNEETHHVETRE